MKNAGILVRQLSPAVLELVGQSDPRALGSSHGQCWGCWGVSPCPDASQCLVTFTCLHHKLCGFVLLLRLFLLLLHCCCLVWGSSVCELHLWFPLLGSGRTLCPGHDLFIICIIGMCKIVWKTILEVLCYAQTAPTCFFSIIPAKLVALSGSLVLGGWYLGAAPELWFSLQWCLHSPSPWSSVWK